MTSVQACRRLDRTLEPKHYHLLLVASPTKPRFKGEVQLDATVTAASDALFLHARGLGIEEASATQQGRALPLRVQPRPGDEGIELRLQRRGERFSRGQIVLRLRYRGTLSSSMHGLYLATDGPEVALVTQCEASDARAILPCLDEPSFKATFRWDVVTEPGYDVIANGRAMGVEKRARYSVHHFAPTALMSTYLLALTIGHFEPGRLKTVAKTPCRIWAGRGKAKQTEFALQITAKVLPWYERYFRAPYAYHKLDQVAVPGFDAGAMENCGAIFYRQSLLLLSAAHSAEAVQKRSAEVIAHEIAHQWFGNLVTMRWWDDLWLNEAFATWIAFKVCDELIPKWEIWLDYLEAKEAALAADALATTHPIYAPVNSPAEATELFDVITYEKGCGVLRMAERFLGPETFRAGIRSYIARHAFGNAEGKDLWGELSAASGQDMRSVMQAWILQAGFPVVSCDLQANDSGCRLHLRQARFAESHDQPRAGSKKPANAQEAKTSHKETVWPIPLVIVYHDGKRTKRVRHLMTATSDQVALEGPVEWAYANEDATGFFRLHHSDKLRAQLLDKGIEHLNTASRLSLLTDEWALTRAGHSRIGHTLDAMVALAADAHPTIVRAIGARLRTMGNVVVAEADAPLFRRFVGDYASRQRTNLGGDVARARPAAEASAYATLLELLGVVARDQATLAMAQMWQRREQRAPDALDPNVAGTLVALSAVDQPADHYRRLLRVYTARKEQGAVPEQQGRYLGALCMAESKASLSLVHQACLDGAIPQEQLRTVLATLLHRRHAQRQTWQFLTEHWTTLGPRIGAMGMARLVEATGALPLAYKDEVQAFFARHPVPQAARAIAKSAESMALWHGLKQREQEHLGQWLKRWAHSLPQAASTSAKKRARK